MIAIRSSSSGVASYSSGWQVTLPADIAANDLILVILGQDGETAMDAAAGWVEVPQGDRSYSDGAFGSVTQAVERLFAPEFRNRLDAVITFRHLDESVVRRIVAKMIGEFAAQLKAKRVALAVRPAAVAWLARRGYSRIFGAREVARLVQEKVKNPFVDAVLFGPLKEGGKARIDVVKDGLAITFAAGGQGAGRRAKGKSKE